MYLFRIIRYFRLDFLDGCNEKVANSGGAFDLTTVFWGNTYPAGPFTLLADNWEVTVDEVLTNADQKLEVPWYDSRTDFKMFP